jgi:hypothetical protein
MQIEPVSLFLDKVLSMYKITDYQKMLYKLSLFMVISNFTERIYCIIDITF